MCASYRIHLLLRYIKFLGDGVSPRCGHPFVSGAEGSDDGRVHLLGLGRAEQGQQRRGVQRRRGAVVPQGGNGGRG